MNGSSVLYFSQLSTLGSLVSLQPVGKPPVGSLEPDDPTHMFGCQLIICQVMEMTGANIIHRLLH